MLSVVFTLAAVSSWTYPGFLARPAATPAPTPPPAVPAGSPSSSPANPILPVVIDPPVDPPVAPPIRPTPETTGPDAAQAPTEPPRYQLADISGQVWEHADLAWLQEFVGDRNRRLVGFPN